MAVIRTVAAGGTASVRRSAAWFATEAIGTFILVFALGVALVSIAAFSPLLIGAPLVATVYAGSRVQGGHYNPALTVAMLIRRRLGLRIAPAVASWLVQFGDDGEGPHSGGRKLRTRIGYNLCALLCGAIDTDGNKRHSR